MLGLRLSIDEDGASLGNLGRAGWGGTLRNDLGRWIVGFEVNLEIRSTFQAEAWGVLYGLNTGWKLGINKIIVETDSDRFLRC